MSLRNLVLVLLAVVAVLVAVGYHRWRDTQQRMALQSLSPSSGVMMVHFFANW